jgi:hypothetical protein
LRKENITQGNKLKQRQIKIVGAKGGNGQEKGKRRGMGKGKGKSKGIPTKENITKLEKQIESHSK